MSCADINAPIGMDKDLVLFNWEDIDVEATLATANIEADDTNGNEKGLTELKLKTGVTGGVYTFEGTEYSVVPTITPEVREIGGFWYLHSVMFTVYKKSAVAREVIESLGADTLVVAAAKDRSTGLYEIFGLERGLRANALERAYTAAQNSNFYTVTLATPDIAVIREPKLPRLAITIPTA